MEDEEFNKWNDGILNDLNPNLILIGFAKGLEQKDISNDILKCVPAEQNIVAAIQTVVADLMEKTEEGVEKALEDAKEVIQA